MRFQKTVLQGEVHTGNGGHSAFAVTPEHRTQWQRDLQQRRKHGRKTSVFRKHRAVDDYIRGDLHPESIGELISVRSTPDGDALVVEIDFHDADAIKAAKAQEGGLSFVFRHEAAEGDEPIAATELISFDLVGCPCDSTQSDFVPIPESRSIVSASLSKRRFNMSAPKTNDGFKKLVADVRGLGLNIPADVSPKGLANALVGATAALAAKAKRKRGPAVAANDFSGEATGVFGGGGPAVLSLDGRRETEPPYIGVPPAKPRCAKQRAADKRYVDEQAARMRGTYRS